MAVGSSGPSQHGVLPQLLRFAVVGGISAVVDFSVYQWGLQVGLPTYGARAMSFVVGTTTAYALNRRWAFKVPGGARRATGFALLYSVTFVVILAVNALALALLSDAWWRVTVAWAFSQGVGTACNFVMLRWVVFRP